MIEDKVIHRLFIRLREVYPEFEGHAQDWQEELAGLSLYDIKRGIERLNPEKYCPTPSVFREICDAPATKYLRRIYEAKDILETLPDCPGSPPRLPKMEGNISGSKAWAKRLQARYEAGESLSTIQLSYAEHVLGRFRKNA